MRYVCYILFLIHFTSFSLSIILFRIYFINFLDILYYIFVCMLLHKLKCSCACISYTFFLSCKIMTPSYIYIYIIIIYVIYSHIFLFCRILIFFNLWLLIYNCDIIYCGDLYVLPVGPEGHKYDEIRGCS